MEEDDSPLSDHITHPLPSIFDIFVSLFCQIDDKTENRRCSKR
jgi:hypothetical protein